MAIAFTAAIVACGCHAKHTTLDDLARRDDVRAEGTFSPDLCACQCDTYICWDFTCSSPRCSRADEYELRVDHGPVSGDGECLDELDPVTAKLVPAEGEPLAPDLVANVCAELSISWRMHPGQFDAAAPHRVEISDGAATWIIDAPFLSHALTLVAPPTAAAPAAGEPPRVRAGESLVIGASPPLSAATARAAVRLDSAIRRPPALSVAVTDDGHLALAIPPEVAPGIYDLTADVGVVLAQDACRGPDTCRGVGAAARWQIAVQPPL